MSDAQPPRALTEIYKSFLVDDDMLALFLDRKPPIVSFHFGVPDAARVRALRDAGIVLFGSATTLAEARVLVDAGIDAIVAQGYEAGGHRGVFDPDAPDDQLGTFALTRILVEALDVPIIAAGGIMDGAGIAAALKLGAVAAQLGTAFIACDESIADSGYRAALFSDAAHHTTMTRAISGRPARCLRNRFTDIGDTVPPTCDPGLSDRLRHRQSAARRVESERRIRFRRAVGRAGRAAGACDVDGVADRATRRGTRDGAAQAVIIRQLHAAHSQGSIALPKSPVLSRCPSSSSFRLPCRSLAPSMSCAAAGSCTGSGFC